MGIISSFICNKKYVTIYSGFSEPRDEYSISFQKVDELLSKYLIYSNAKLNDDIIFDNKCIPACFQYKYIVLLASEKTYLFFDYDNILRYIITNCLPRCHSELIIMPIDISKYEDLINHLNYGPGGEGARAAETHFSIMTESCNQLIK